MSEKEENLKEMGFFDHLLELRATIIWILVVWLGSSIVLWFFSARLLDLLLSAIPVDSLYFNAPIEAFMVRLKLSFIIGALLAFPFALFKLWAFVSPGLFSREKRVIVPMIAPSRPRIGAPLSAISRRWFSEPSSTPGVSRARDKPSAIT